ncbi:hypothetical protein E9840_01370 [Tissierella creatinini]|nr:hypothetical protein E9840_01370 [Tissierella creatinini]TJX64163.1 hypothetical protein E8P77_12980 [Soehngenia saccharolytica]
MKKYKYLIILIILGAIGVGGFFLLNKEEVLNVSIMSSYRGSVKKTIELSGIIESNNIEIIPLEPNWDVVKTYVSENDYVEANQILVEFDTKDINLSIRKAKVSIEDLNAKINALNNDQDSKMLLDNALSRSNEEYLSAQKDLEIATEDLSQAEMLYSVGGISKAELDSQKELVEKLTSNLSKADLSLKDSSLNQNKSEVEKKQSIASLQRQIKALNLDIEGFNSMLRDSKLYSSIGGYLTEFPLENSDKTTAGQTIKIYGNDSYELVAQVSQQDAVLIKEGQKGIVTIDGLNSEYEGQVKYISKVAYTDNSGLEPKVEIRIEVLNPDESIVFGYEAKADIILDSKDNALIVRNEAVKKEDGKEFVFTVDQGIAKKLIVQTGITDDYFIEIVNGISEDSVVILNPPVDLIEGMAVQVVE